MIERNKIIKYLIFGLIFFGTCIFLIIRGRILERETEFSGIIKKIEFNEKKTPTVLINNKKYVLFFSSWRFNEKMEIGDSLIKEKKSTIYKLIKCTTGEVILSDKK